MKLFFFLSIVFLVSLSIASAQQLEVLNTNYHPGETVQAFSYDGTISAANIYLLDNESNTVSISPLVSNYRDDDYFFYFNLPTSLIAGTYFLNANTESANFTVTEGTAITIKPGIIILSETDTFTVELENIGEDPITTQISANDGNVIPRRSVLEVDTTKDLIADYDYDAITQDSELRIAYGTTTYTVPLIYPDLIEETNQTNVTQEVNATMNVTEGNLTNITVTENITITNITQNPFEFITTKSSHEYQFYPDESLAGPLEIKNNGNESIFVEVLLTNNLSQVIQLNATNFTIEPNSSYHLYTAINSNENATVGLYEGELVIFSETFNTSLPISVEIVQDGEVIEDPEIDWDSVNWTIPNDQQQESGSGILVIGIIMVIILIGIFVVLYMKLTQPPKKEFSTVIQERSS